MTTDDDQPEPPESASTPSPHDALFRLTFERPEHASSMLRALLPAELTKHVDWSSLELAPGSFRDEELRKSETDVLFRTKLNDGRQALLYVLIEHQSTVDPMMARRLARYAMRVHERWERENPRARHMPALFPFVVAHAEGRWTAATSLLELYDLDPAMRDELSPWLLNQRYVLYDLSQEPSQALRDGLRASSLARLALLVMQRRSAADLLAELRSWGSVLREVRATPTGADDIVMLMVYIHLTADVELPVVGKVLRDEVGAEEDEAMSAAEKLLAQIGPAKWLQKGRAEGRAELVLRQLARRFGPLSADAEARVRAASVDELDRMGERVLDAASLEEVLAP